MPTMTELRQERADLAQKAQELSNLANADRREMTRVEEQDFEKLIRQAEALTVRIDKEERLGAVIDSMETAHRPAVKMGSDGSDESEERAFRQHLGSGKKFRSFGEQLMAVMHHASGRATDGRLFETRALGANEAIGTDGGFLLQPEFSQSIFMRAYETGQVVSRCDRIALGPNTNSMKIPAINESSRVDGSRWGGVLAYWQGEGVAGTPTRPKFRMMDLTLKKLMALCYATDEMLQDSTALESIIGKAFSDEMGFQLDTAAILGIGGGQPLGILNAAATVSVAAASGSGVRILSADVLAMYQRMYAPSRSNAVWFINQDTEAQLYSMTLGTATVNQAVFLPPGGLSGAPYATLMGRPVVPIEQCSTLGTVGDIIFADMSQYVLADKGGLQSASSIHVAFLTDEQVFRFVYRVDGQPKWQAALTPYKGTNTLSPFITLAVRT